MNIYRRDFFRYERKQFYCLTYREHVFYINVSRTVHDICSSVISAFIFKIKSSIFGNFNPVYIIVDEKIIYIHIQGGITDVSAKTKTLLVKLRCAEH